MDIRCKIKDLQFSISGNQILSLELQEDFRNSYEKFKDKDLTVSIKPYRPKRSLDANAYMWTLCEKLAESQGITRLEVYRNAVREVGTYRDFTDMTPDEARMLRADWENLGIGWQTEVVDYMPDGVNLYVRCYYGSSQYDSKQMSRLIDYIVQDCKAVGIETMTPAELESLYASM